MVVFFIKRKFFKDAIFITKLLVETRRTRLFPQKDPVYVSSSKQLNTRMSKVNLICDNSSKVVPYG